ncbi:MAG: hypothetical protein A3E37_00405 [Candidatus Andersenbacteria bacterium RIFCSPHIGHO2_12_FULL_46_9]|nr:MAG: recombinase [Parcubacteria group bacterium GW2011_GWA2_45_14]OGY34774.1 MAG: hypothetical protein A3B76_00205 [Candidatus Andersenbacteria bacterium RIFCSPHIGHO2_02_FULL_46_16]OGY35912.1 MAG: hypothetical protein A3E37_00405 [Candidatus Andersenbacteria bacterium RIFCSPHIGHO2_12_FULL_46_9]OGY38129.1 MAG: hypothetical protein A3I08_03995 [Candidatus Andersenbacteria bacterium RIFCSPLOWO2_02_FULL_46_11]OGY39437.1 MAG: hypothetical protein A3G57_00550 [Candidatus Andersenbacteria bacterium
MQDSGTVPATMVNINYCLYARKSTESDELQALSIDSQIKEMLALAERDGVTVKEIRRESHSAKESFTRPVFLQLIQDIRAGQFGGILTWAPDRLSRNAGDLGALVDLMDQGRLEEIRTHGQIFHNSPNEKFLLMILCSQAKLENDNRSVNVKRGLRAKCEMGYRPGITPLGYINLKYEIKGQKKVVLDPKRAPVIKEMFEKAALGCSGRDLLHWMNEIKGFRTKTDKKVALSAIYVMLHNPYYSGRFEYPKAGGKWYKVKHQSIVTRKLWKEVQEKLTVDPKSKPGTKVFDFTKMLTCGSCGSGVTAEEKCKDIIDGTKRRYVYYHCTRARNLNCKEPYIREEALVNQLVNIIDKVDIDKLAVENRFTEDLIRYRGFMESVLKKSGQVMTATNIDIRDYAKHILMTGKREDKQAIMACVTTTLYLTQKRIMLKRVTSAKQRTNLDDKVHEYHP